MRQSAKDKSCRGQKSQADRKSDMANGTFSEAAAAASSTHRSTGNPSFRGHNLKIRRQTLLSEDGLDSDPCSHREARGSCPNFSMDALVSGSRSVLSHQNAHTVAPPASSARGQSPDLHFELSNDAVKTNLRPVNVFHWAILLLKLCPGSFKRFSVF